MGNTVFPHHFHKINYIDFDHAGFCAESQITLCPISAYGAPDRLLVILIEAYSFLASVYCTHVHYRPFHNFQLPLTDKFLKSDPAKTYQFRVCFKCDNTKALTQVKLSIFPLVHSNIIDEIVVFWSCDKVAHDPFFVATYAPSHRVRKSSRKFSWRYQFSTSLLECRY